MWWWVVCAALAVSGASVPTLASGGYKVVCYYASWAHYRQGEARYSVMDVPVEQCTHVIYAHVLLNETSLTLAPGDPSLDIDLLNYRNFVQLRHRNPQIKLLLGLGGLKDSRSEKYTQLVSQPHHRAAFIDHALDFLTTYGFDGLDLDWQYPDYDGFRQWVEELHAAFEPYHLLLTASVSPLSSVIDRGYDIAVMEKTLDQVHVITYDMYGSWDSQVANPAPLFLARENELSVDLAVEYWLKKKGISASKLVVGVPFFGRSWTLSGVDDRVGAKSSGAGLPGPLTKAAGTLAYYEVCQKRLDGWKKVLGDDGPHLTNGDQWIGYDDIVTVTNKAEYARQKDLGGVMVWEVSMDDFHGSCGAGINPLISAIVHTLRRSDNITNGTVHELPTSTPQPKPELTTSPRPATSTTRRKPKLTISQRPATSTPQPKPKFKTSPRPATSTPQPKHELTTSPRPATSTTRRKPRLTTSPRPATSTPQPQPSTIIPVDIVECHQKGYTRDTASCNLFFKCIGDQMYHLRCNNGLHWNQEHTFCDWPRRGLCKL